MCFRIIKVKRRRRLKCIFAKKIASCIAGIKIKTLIDIIHPILLASSGDRLW